MTQTHESNEPATRQWVLDRLKEFSDELAARLHTARLQVGDTARPHVTITASEKNAVVCAVNPRVDLRAELRAVNDPDCKVAGVELVGGGNVYAQFDVMEGDDGPSASLAIDDPAIPGGWITLDRAGLRPAPEFSADRASPRD